MYFFAGGRVGFRKRAREGVGGDGERIALGLVWLVELQHREGMGVCLLLGIRVSKGGNR